jgi:hypothetical protein
LTREKIVDIVADDEDNGNLKRCYFVQLNPGLALVTLAKTATIFGLLYLIKKSQ